MNRRPSYASVAAGGTSRAGILVPPRPRADSDDSSPSPELGPIRDSGPAPVPMTTASSPPQNQRPIMAHQADQQDVAGSNLEPNQLAEPWANDRVRYANIARHRRHTVMGGGGPGQSHERFIMPSYLADSRYMARLVAKQEEKEAARRELADGAPSVRPSRSSSSSNLSGGRMVPSHRGMTYEVVEARTPDGPGGSRGEIEAAPLPSRWMGGQLEILAGGTALRWPPGQRTTEPDATGCVMTDQPMPVAAGVYYFEIHIEHQPRGGYVAIGIASHNMSPTKLPGWELRSWGWHSDDGKKYHGHQAGSSYSKEWGKKNDTVGCGVNFWEQTIFFTLNGNRLADAFHDLDRSDMAKMYPCVGMKAPGAKILVNLGQEAFKYDIEGEVQKQREKARSQYVATKLSRVTSGKKDDDFVKELVAQFLRHGGYVETARSFISECQTEHKALGTAFNIAGNAAEEDIDAAQRQQIRSAILNGDVEKAIRCTNDFYPQVLPDNPIIAFRLKCRKFLEMIRKTTESQQMESQAASVSTLKKERAKATLPGSSTVNMPGAMDLDEPIDDAVPASNGSMSAGVSSVVDLQAAIAEGSQLQAMYGQDTRKEIRDMMRHIMGIWAYTDPTKSKEVGYLFTQAERVKTAEELNSAILVSMGKSAVAAIERMAQQTEALVEEITDPGLPGAFVNLDLDIFQAD